MPRARRVALLVFLLVLLASLFSLAVSTPFLPVSIATNRALLAVLALGCLLALL